MRKYLSWTLPWLYYLFGVLVTAVFVLRPALVYVFEKLYGPTQGEAYTRVNGIYFPALWVIYFFVVLTLIVSGTYVKFEGGAKHWSFLILSGLFTAYFTYFLVLLGGAPGGILG